MSRVHIWLGINDSNDETFEKYFELDYNTDVEIGDPAYQVCPFCVDIHEDWYDEDMIEVYKTDHLISVAEALEDVAISKETVLAINAICGRKGIKNVNAMFLYIDADLNITDTEKLFNGIVYMGKFKTTF
ncbi:immunity 22 family protein [Solibacillus sp. FSL K6-1523]|uniref:immunity 22 family protein n=1 Tax=Solibacillus sp. FSL K6-1523 TaxID=2921471 RepID=UPI0030FA035B